MRISAFLAAVVTLVSWSASAHAGSVLELKAENYNATTGIWTDTSGQSNHASQGSVGNRPGLVAGQTGAGSSVVRFDGVNDHLDLASAISASGANGITAFVFFRSPGGLNTIFAGNANSSFQYRTNSGVQQLIRSGVQFVGGGSTALSTTEFNNINVIANNAGGAFRLNGAADGTFGAPGGGFGPITTIGLRDQHGGIEVFGGDIAEIRIYDMQLTASEIAAVEADLSAAYSAAAVVPLPSGALVGFGLLALLAAARRLRRRQTA